MADADHFKQVASIIKADPSRRYVVASAPGKRSGDDEKVTDMLYNCYNMIKNREDISDYYQKIVKKIIMLLLLKILKTLRSKFKLLSYFKLKLKFKYEELYVLAYLS